MSDPTENDMTGIDFEFDCPECGTHIQGEVDRCPSCGVEFVIEEVAELECPACHAAMPGDSRSCPLCGRGMVEDAPLREQQEPERKDLKEEAEKEQKEREKALREEFSVLVSRVGPLVALAKDHSIDTTAARRQIDKAVTLGKRREVDPAVRSMRECQEMLERSIADRLERDIMYLEGLAEVARKMGSDHQAIEKVVADTRERMSAQDLAGALDQVRSGKLLAEQLTGKYVEAHELYEGLEKLILNSEMFYLDVREPRKLLNEAREAGDGGDWTTMGILARKGQEELNGALPDMLAVELRKAKQSLLDAKARGKDVTTMIKVLKDAGVSMKRERYGEALERLTEFHAEEKKL
ncbi:MAG: zinc ribbon domain-containing protein [Methanomassiliicoccus sp.]|nr:zinc ribbon domain-containing protein [Methanomassiliicoccus sp.]